MAQVRMIAPSESTMVMARRSPITSSTDLRHIIEVPKSPLKTPPIHLRYCTYIGLSSAYWRRRDSKCCSETLDCVADSWAM